MPRPKKWRRVCCLPIATDFTPNNCKDETVIMSVDEYETIRLIDHQGFTQEECGKYMEIARTTVQQIYNDARKKIAISIVEGKSLKITGGEYTLCDGKEKNCNCGGCALHKKAN